MLFRFSFIYKRGGSSVSLGVEETLLLVLIFVRYRRIFPAGEFLKTVLKYNAEKRKFTFFKKRCRGSFTGRRRALDIEENVSWVDFHCRVIFTFVRT